MIVLGLGGTAGLIRIMRANLLDELHKPYVITGQGQGAEGVRCPDRVPGARGAQPLCQHGGLDAAGLVSGATIVSVVLNLPTTGPMLLQALLAQDMYLAGSFILLLSVLTVIGTLISDILLAWLDPRIRYNEGRDEPTRL